MEATSILPQGEYKSFGNLWKRGVASIADGFVLGVPYMLIVIFFLLINKEASLDMSSLSFQQSLWFLMLAILFQFVIPAIYFTYMVGKYGMSLGKKALNLRIFNEDGSEVNYKKAFFRYLCFFLYSIPFLGLVLFIVSVILVIVDPKKQALHDKLCKTVVLFKH